MNRKEWTEEGFRGLVAELLLELDGSYGHTADILIEAIKERLRVGTIPFWPACALCGKPIATEAEAEEIWIGPINKPGGKKGYVHRGNGDCFKNPTAKGQDA